MLSLLPQATLDANAEAIISDRRVSTWRNLLQDAEEMVRQYRDLAQRRIGIGFRATPGCCATLIALERLSCDTFLLSPDLAESDVDALGTHLKLGAILTDTADRGVETFRIQERQGEAPGSGRSSVTLLTSGTTGEPKAVRHSWVSLARPVRIDSRYPSPRWLLTYRPNLYAGLQVLLQCLMNGGTLIVPPFAARAQEVAQLALDTQAQFASGTPSYWRWLLTFAEPETLKRLPLMQITLGGEIVDQSILDALRDRFPAARLVSIYATTELGRCFSVTDGKAGFPAEFLEKPLPDGIELRIDQGELLVRSANAMQGYDTVATPLRPVSDYFRTGDLVDVVGDRVYFAGRESDVINVGGNKVQPSEVERVLQAIPGVADVRVYAKTSSIVGQLVACEIVPARDQDREQLLEVVQATCRTTLASYQQPRIIDMVAEISLSNASKKLRSSLP